MTKNSTTIYLPGLNGLRAIAALSVVISHISIASNDFGLGNHGGWFFASYGVTIFFTLSGFLITFLLLKENEKQIIDIKKFYVRRILRIWPIYYLYLIIALIILVISYQINISSLPYYFFFCANVPYIFGGSQLLIAHLWSIGVEEQFYLFWPVLIKIFNKRIKVIVILLILILISLKFIVRYFSYNLTLITFLEVNRFECMLIGAIGAILYNEKNIITNKYLLNFYVQFLAWITLLFIVLGKINTPGPTEDVFMSFVTLILIIGQISLNSKKIINLENKTFDFLGKISYGIYVIHPLIIYLLSKLLGNMNLNFYAKFIIVYFGVILLTILISHISYKYYEKPFLKLKKQFAVVKSENSMCN